MAFSAFTGGGGSGNSDESFLTLSDETAQLPNSFSLGSLTTGLMKNTVSAGSGVVSTAIAGTDYYAPGGTDVALADGGTNASLVASNGGIFYSTAAAGAILAGTATARQMLQSGASTTPAWSTATYPATTTVSRILYSSANNVIGEITTANDGLLVTSGTGVPSISTAIPSGVTATTQAFGTSNTTLATTAFVQAAREQIVNAQTAGYTAVAGDLAKVIRYTGAGGVTLALTAAATLTDGWFATLRNDSSGTITIDPNGAETINGAATLAVAAGKAVIIYTNGTLFYTVGENAASSGGTTMNTYATFNASSGAPVIGSSLNVSSITDGGVGIFTLNFTASYADTNYKIAGICGGSGRIGDGIDWATRATGTTQLRTGTPSALTDLENNSVMIFA